MFKFHFTYKTKNVCNHITSSIHFWKFFDGGNLWQTSKKEMITSGCGYTSLDHTRIKRESCGTHRMRSHSLPFDRDKNNIAY